MLLSVKPPLPNGINGIKSIHEYDYSHHTKTPSRYSPDSPPPLPSFFENSDSTRMNNQHRGLPPPIGLTLPPPDRSNASLAPLGNLPAPPAQWTGADESMRNWLLAKAEEDKRKQEEERSRQEGLRLDQRKIEQNMLRESLQGGIPPVMVPLIFAGMGGSSLSSQTLEWAQHYMAQLSLQNQQQQQQLQAQQQQQVQQQQQIQQQQQQTSPDIRRDARMIPPNPYGGHQPLQPAQPTQQIPLQPTQQSLGRQLMAPTSVPRTSSSSDLSRINTVVPQIQTAQVPPSQNTGQQLHSLQQPQQPPTDSQQGSAPGLFFHHWTPTAASTKSNQPPTPSGKSNQGSPFSQQANSHLRSEYQNSPKKRKAAGGHPISAPPTSQPSDISPPFSSRSSRERETSPGSRNKARRHSRQRSDASSNKEYEGRNLARPSSRQQRHDELSGTGEDVPKRQHTGPLTSASREEGPTRYGGSTHETRQSTYSAGPEMREHPAKREV